jgi:hypothetical protein
MKTKHFFKGLLFGAALALASAAYAGEKASVMIYEDVKVNGKTLAPGEYNLSWEGSGNNVQLNIKKNKQTVATVPAQVETSASAPTNTGYATKQADDGSRSLTSVFFSGKKYSLNLDQQAAAGSAPASATPGNQ